MDPITKTLLEYREYLREGGRPVSLAEQGFDEGHKHEAEWMFYPSSLCLCDRAAAYKALSEHGLLPTHPPTEEERLKTLMHLPGFIVQEAIANALVWKDALIAYEFPVRNDIWKGRGDLLVDPKAFGIDDHPWIIDVKANKGYSLGNKYPKENNIAQVQLTKELMEHQARPMLYYTLRVDMSVSALYTWSFTYGTCHVYEWKGEDWDNDSRDISDMEEMYLGSKRVIETWGEDVLRVCGGHAPSINEKEQVESVTLPPRCGATPFDHPFMCAMYDKNARAYKVNCDQFARCWERKIQPGSIIRKNNW